MTKPLAERLRPQRLEDYVGQQHLVGEGAVLQQMIRSKQVSSFILWGPPGVGKTTLAQLLAHEMGVEFYTLNAVTSGVKDVRDIIERIQGNTLFQANTPLLFIDEIHRFNKTQQDSLLGAVERGTFILIGATTENPSFEIIRPLLSRSQVYILHPLKKEELQTLLYRAIETDELLSQHTFDIQQTDALYQLSAGDGRKLLNILELIYHAEADKGSIIINNDNVTRLTQQNIATYDKDGELHYDIVSAYIKSIRGSDPDAAIYWLARMIAGGEDPKFIARRLVIAASEDIGLANPNALLIANAAFDAVNKIGWPEGRIPLAEATIYLASSPKSNSAYTAINKALKLVEATGNVAVPLHLRNAPTQLMQELGYGRDYVYPHDYQNNYITQTYMPEEVTCQLWTPQNNSQELRLQEQIKTRRAGQST